MGKIFLFVVCYFLVGYGIFLIQSFVYTKYNKDKPFSSFYWMLIWPLILVFLFVCVLIYELDSFLSKVKNSFDVMDEKVQKKMLSLVKK